MTTTAPLWSLPRLIAVLRKSWIAIVAATIVGGAAAFGLSAITTPTYASTSTLYFTLNQGNSASDLVQGSTYTQNQMLSFARLATSSRVLEPVIQQLNLETTPRELARSVKVSIPQDTVTLEVTMTDTVPERAAEVANSIASSLTNVVGEIATGGAGGAATVAAELIDVAVVPTVQSSPNKPRDALLGMLLGFAASTAIALVVALADTRVRNEDVAEEATGAPLLGSVTRVARGSDARLLVARDPLGHMAEELRRVASALTFANVAEPAKTVVITSSVPREGKSTITSNLALVLAGLDKRVLVIDADLRRPQVSEHFGIEGDVGLTSVLVGNVSFDDARVRRENLGVDVLAAGAVPPNPAELLTSEAVRELLASVADRYDAILIDAPPLLSVADAALMAPRVDGVIVIVDSSRTRSAQLARAMRDLEGAGARIVGVVLNKTRSSSRRKRYYREDTPKPSLAR